MSVGPLGFVAGVAGTPLSQAHGGDVDRLQQETSNQTRQVRGQQQAADAAGVGTTEQDSQAEDRDADGRRLWEPAPSPPREETDPLEAETQPRARDPQGQSGTELDLLG